MKRRHLLQMGGAGLLLPLTGLAGARDGEVSLAESRPSTRLPPDTRSDVVKRAWDDPFAPPRSWCLGLGAGAEPVIRVLQARTDIDQVELMAEQATEPQAITDWLRLQPAPGDYVVVLIDASDTLALADLASHAPRWRPSGCVYAIAIVLNAAPPPGGSPREETWRAPLAKCFDAVVEPAAGSIASQRLAIQLLIDGVLLLSRSLIGYDPGDIRTAFRSAGRQRSAAAVWSRPDQLARTLERMGERGLADHSGDLLAFVHAGTGFGIDEFSELMDELRVRLNSPEEAGLLGTAFWHADWPPERRVLGLTG